MAATTWQRVLFVNDRTGAADIAMDPSNPQVLYATTWEVLRTPWGITSTGPGGGLYKSTDGGDTWSRLTSGLPASNLGKIGVTVSPVNPQRVWATVEADDKGGVYRSDDGGSTWQLLNDGFNMTSRQYYYGHIFADPLDVNTVYTFCAKYFYKSTDGGKTYIEVQTPHGDYHDLWIDPKNSRRMVNGSDGGAAITFNGGRSWSSHRQPADRAVLRGDHRSRHALPHLRLAAGQHHRVDRQPHQRRRHHGERLACGRRRRERLPRADRVELRPSCTAAATSA